ncbi:pilin [Haliovirga abyssi]|uniref:Prepilin-type N-terminal cleavage/methylation domain-containing protein n=1 Tax=Haliovirga abyssi TaxID=2996794 RepID=A0AAU9DUE6_9FUSO|nr:prepilin-type N-terminal cleavage/methylation domain-containing protein [Haliovirga abyssi]BDU49576.1 hypothetical protein HLVA_01450 [Haliovirga abyssi]
MQKGFTLIELMIVVAIIGVLSFTGGVTISSSIIKNSVNKAKAQVPAYLNNGVDRAFEEGSGYTIGFNSNEITLTGKESLTLPRNLKYLYRIGSAIPSNSSISVNINEQGKLSGEFDFYIGDKKNNFYYRIHGRNIAGINLGVIEEYNPNATATVSQAGIGVETNWTLVE